ncbi:MAG: hemerythrin family protein [Anaeromyxobacter sp.]
MTETHAWNAQLDLGHEAMDHEHHLQIALVSAFIEAVEQARPILARQLADQLERYSVVHFGSEELLMDATGYAGRARHAGEHAEFLSQIRGLAGDLDAGATDPAIASAIDLRAALAAHMNEADRRLAGHVTPRTVVRGS